MKKIIISTFLIVTCFTMSSCDDPLTPGKPVILTLPTCTWVNDIELNFMKINLKMPTTNRFYGTNATEFITFPEVFQFGTGAISSSNIKITTTVAGCNGTLSKSISYTSMYADGLLASGFTKQNRVSTVAASAHAVTIEMTSGLWTSITTGEKGTIVWSTNLGSNPYSLQPSLNAEGTFKATISKIPQSVFVATKFVRVLI